MSLAEELKFILRDGKINARYLGYVGYGNLGDEVLYKAIAELFAREIDFYALMEMGSIVRLLRSYLNFQAIFLGGGTLIKGPSMHLKRIKNSFEDFFRASFIVFGTGVGDADMWERFGSKTNKKEWCEVLEQSAYLSVRGPLSKKYLQDWGVKKEIHVIGDPVIWFAREQVNWKRKHKRIGLNLGPSLGKRGQIHGQDEMYVLKFGSQLLRYLDSQGWQITLFPMAEADVDYLTEAVKMAGIDTLPIKKAYLDLNSTLNALEEQDIFVGEKLHSVILASCVHTPSIMFEYRTKCRDFMLSIDREAFVFRTDNLNLDLIIECLNGLYENLEQHQKHIFSQMKSKKDSLQMAANKIVDIITNEKLND